MALIRLNKYLAERGIASRREADRLIEAGEVKVNGKVVSTLGVKVDPEKDTVEVSHQAQKEREKLVTIALHKPLGYVSSMKRTPLEPHIVTDLVNVPERVVPVGRLDKDSSGLLLLSNDGTLTYSLTHPSAQCEKEYEVKVKGAITPGAIEKLRAGVKLWGERTLPTEVKRVAKNVIRIILREGKNRQIRRICQKVGTPVKALKRIRIKTLWLGNLPLGQWRYLTSEELKALKT